MGEDPDQIRREIEATRSDMGETVDALGYKADVKSRAKDKVTETKDRLTGRVSSATPDTGEVKAGAKRAAGVAQQNPIGLALGSLGAGLIIGMLLPSSRVEDEKLGSLSDDVTEKVKETAQEAVDRGREVAQEAAASAQETVRERGRDHGEQLAASARENAQDVAPR
jgi:hypothetical protein